MQEFKQIFKYTHGSIVKLMELFTPFIGIATLLLVSQEFFNFNIFAEKILLFISGVAGCFVIVGYLMAILIAFVNSLHKDHINAVKGILFGLFCVFLHILS